MSTHCFCKWFIISKENIETNPWFLDGPDLSMITHSLSDMLAETSHWVMTCLCKWNLWPNFPMLCKSLNDFHRGQALGQSGSFRRSERLLVFIFNSFFRSEVKRHRLLLICRSSNQSAIAAKSNKIGLV